jgi:hypothetical protein
MSMGIWKQLSLLGFHCDCCPCLLLALPSPFTFPAPQGSCLMDRWPLLIESYDMHCSVLPDMLKQKNRIGGATGGSQLYFDLHVHYYHNSAVSFTFTQPKMERRR